MNKTSIVRSLCQTFFLCLLLVATISNVWSAENRTNNNNFKTGNNSDVGSIDSGAISVLPSKPTSGHKKIYRSIEPIYEEHDAGFRLEGDLVI